MKTRIKAVKAPTGPTRPLIHPNNFPGMSALSELIFDYEQFFQSGKPTQQAMFDQLWGSFNELWDSVDNYMGNPSLPSAEQFRKNEAYLRSAAKGDPFEAARDLEGYLRRRVMKVA
jgi:hypothetical protein